MSYRLARTAVAAILASTMSGAVAADAIKIAFLGSLSGPFALQGEETLKNVQAAADLVNARGGILQGRQIEMVTGREPDRTLQKSGSDQSELRVEPTSGHGP